MRRAFQAPVFWFLVISISGLILSGIRPFDYFTWILEVVPGIIAIGLIAIYHKKFPLTDLLYFLILIHCLILFIGGHYTYAKVPLFEYIKDAFNHQRNNYDKVGHFMQGFVPAMVAREILLRKQVVNAKGWLFFICLCVVLAISASYELIETFMVLVTGDSAEAFMGTQGYVWDAQSDMFFAFIGAIMALSLLSPLHNRSLEKLKVK